MANTIYLPVPPGQVTEEQFVVDCKNMDYLFENIPQHLRPADFDDLAVVWYGLPLDMRIGNSFLGSQLGEHDLDFFFSFLRSNISPKVEFLSQAGPPEEPVVEEEIKPAAKRGRKPAQLSLLSPYPTELTRCSCFFPSQRSGGKREMVEFEIANPWGVLRFKGPRLSVSHCDLLVVLLAAANDKGKHKVEKVDGETTYTYHGSLRELLVARGNKNPNARDYDAAFDLIEDMAGAVFSFRRSGEDLCDKKEPRRRFATMITCGERFDDGAFSVTLNPFFVDRILQKRVTWQDIQERTKIKSPYAKALALFFSGQPNNWRGGIDILAQAINMPGNFSRSKIREKLRSSITELTKLGILEKKSFVEGNVVSLQRAKKSIKK